MKQTTKILLAITGALALAVVLLTVWARLSVGGILESGRSDEEAVELSGSRVERSFEVGSFSRIEVKGGWEVDVRAGNPAAVSVTADEALMDELTVEASGGTLTLGSESWNFGRDARLSAEITVPSLDAVSVSGGVDGTISGFSGSSLALDISGAADIDGTDNSYERLNVTVEGAADVDFADSRAVNAEVRLDGAGNIELTMAGGELTGRIGGVGSVTYGGEVSREAVAVEGVGSVERR